MTAAAQCVPKLFFLAFAGICLLLWLLFRNAGNPRKRYRRAFGLAALFGAVYAAGTYHWLWYLLRADWLSMDGAARVLVLLGASAVLSIQSALLSGLWALVVTRAQVRLPGHLRWVLVPVTAGLCWMVLEFLQSVTFRGFPVFGLPWVRLASAFTPVPALLQQTALWGSLGAGGFLVFCAGLLAKGLVSDISASRRMAALGLCGLLLFADIGVGTLRLHLPGAPGIPLSVSVVQGNLDAVDKWSAEGAALAWERYSSLSRDAELSDLIVWTESAVPVTVERAPELDAELRQLAFDCDSTILAGLFHRTDGKVYNSVYAYDGDGSRTEEPYSKRYPVPFGEYLPFPDTLGKLIPSLSSLNIMRDPITAGESTEPLASFAGKTGVLVCFDCAYPDAARKETAAGAEYLCILSNSAWFFDSAACTQARAAAVLRALENGRDTVLSSSTGISAVIDEKGCVLCESEPLETGVLHSILTRRTGRTPCSYLPEWALAAGAFVLLAGIFCANGQNHRKNKKKL